MTEFVDFARERGAQRFVLQSASSIEEGGPAMGKVHSYLKKLGGQGAVEWAVLRPTWFQRTFSLSGIVLLKEGGGIADCGNRKLCRPAESRQEHPGGEQGILGYGRGQDPLGVGRRYRGCGGTGVDG
jgi:hypothetical protein